MLSTCLFAVSQWSPLEWRGFQGIRIIWALSMREVNRKSVVGKEVSTKYRRAYSAVETALNKLLAGILLQVSAY